MLDQWVAVSEQNGDAKRPAGRDFRLFNVRTERTVNVVFYQFALAAFRQSPLRATQSMRIGIIALLHESNTFSSQPTKIEAFRQNLLLHGEPIREVLSDAHHEVACVLLRRRS